MNWDDDNWEPTPFLSGNQKSKWEDEDQDLKATKVISPLLEKGIVPDRKAVKQRFNPLSRKKRLQKEEKLVQKLTSAPSILSKTEEERLKARKKQMDGENKLIQELFGDISSSSEEEKEGDKDNDELWGSDSKSLDSEEDTFQKIDELNSNDTVNFKDLALLLSEKISLHSQHPNYCDFLKDLLRSTIPSLSILELDNLLGVITVRRNDLLTANKKPKTRKMSKKHYKDGKYSVPLVGGYWLVLGQKRIRNLYTGPLQILEEYFVIEAKIL